MSTIHSMQSYFSFSAQRHFRSGCSGTKFRKLWFSQRIETGHGLHNHFAKLQSTICGRHVLPLHRFWIHHFNEEKNKLVQCSMFCFNWFSLRTTRIPDQFKMHRSQYAIRKCPCANVSKYIYHNHNQLAFIQLELYSLQYFIVRSMFRRSFTCFTNRKCQLIGQWSLLSWSICHKILFTASRRR